MAMDELRLPYPDFQMGKIIDPEEHDLNNQYLSNKINDLIELLNKVTDGEGAKVVKLNPKAPFTSTNVQDALDELITRLQSKTTATGASLIGSPALVKLAGDNVEAQLVALDNILQTAYVITSSIADLAITTAKLAQGAVTTEKIADANVTTTKVADGNITTPKIADASVVTLKLADGNVTTVKIADLAVVSEKIANLAVTTAKYADFSVTTSKIADGNITSSKIANQSVTDIKIADLAVTAQKIAMNTVNTQHLANGSVTSDKLANRSVTSNKIGTQAVKVEHIDPELLQFLPQSTLTQKVLTLENEMDSAQLQLNILDELKTGNAMEEIARAVTQRPPSYYYAMGQRVTWENWHEVALIVPNAVTDQWAPVQTICPYVSAEHDKITQIMYTQRGIYTRGSVGNVTATSTWGAWVKIVTSDTLATHVNTLSNHTSNSGIHVTQELKNLISTAVQNNVVYDNRYVHNVGRRVEGNIYFNGWQSTTSAEVMIIRLPKIDIQGMFKISIVSAFSNSNPTGGVSFVSEIGIWSNRLMVSNTKILTIGDDFRYLYYLGPWSDDNSDTNDYIYMPVMQRTSNGNNPMNINIEILSNDNASTTRRFIDEMSVYSIVMNSPETKMNADLFQSVSSGKSAIASAITGKGVATNATAEFATMANNIGAINTGKKFASGTATSSSVGIDFTYTGSSSYINMYYISVSNLGFTPSYIIANCLVSGGNYTTTVFHSGTSLRSNVCYSTTVGASSNLSYYFDANGRSGYVNSNGFLIPTYTGNNAYTWYAFE